MNLLQPSTIRAARAAGSLLAVLHLMPTTAEGGVSYLDPAGGWRYTYDGTFNPGVVDPGFVGGVGPAGFGSPSDRDALDGAWQHNQSDQWDGSAPGDPLSDPTVASNPLGSLTGRQGISPGGAGSFDESGTTYIRVQDAGNPEAHGWVQGNLDDPSAPDHPIRTNRRVYFGHNMQQDGLLTGDEELVIDNGFTLSFRARIPVSGPLDDIYSEFDADGDGNRDIIPWFEGAPNGRGARMLNSRGMFNVIQNDPVFGDEDTSIGFSLVNSTDIGGFCGGGSGSLCEGSGSGGLIMNNLNGNTPTAFIDSGSPGTLNIVELTDDELNQWNEFWITMEANGPVAGNTTVSVYMNGSTTPQVFEVTLAGRGNAVYQGSQDPFLEFGIASNAFFASFDLDFISYQLGVLAPVPVPARPGDYNEDGVVDAADYTVWRDLLGASATELANDVDGGTVDQRQYDTWKTHFGTSYAAVSSAITPVPEPHGAPLTGLACAASFACIRFARRSRNPASLGL